MTKAIPDRWEAYNPIGKKIEGTRFIAFKVPLRERVSVTVESEKRLDNRILLNTIPKLGLIIDLTNTRRYYDPNTFVKEGIQYEKIMIPGRETPPKYLAEKFINVVRDFVNRNKDNDKLIGVHCTHGVNRTGYLICYYMISQLTVEAKDAMAKFAHARGYPIERPNYITDLVNLKYMKSEVYENKRNLKRPRDSRREIHENYKLGNISNKNDSDRGLSAKRRRYTSRANFKNEGNFSSRRPTDQTAETSYSVERSVDHRSTMTHLPPALILDYYNTKPTFDTHNRNYNRYSNKHRKNN